MSKMTVFVCDFCEAEDASRTKVSVGSIQLTADLCCNCVEGLVERIKAFVPGIVELKKSSSGVDAKAIRAWAAENGINVPARGRIGAELRATYDDAMTRNLGDLAPGENRGETVDVEL